MIIRNIDCKRAAIRFRPLAEIPLGLLACNFDILDIKEAENKISKDLGQVNSMPK